ncbi:MAG: hypothetical protein KF778_17245 [Rhodocyclaceae bacterium]|nr:hypothetical protein [Rhodocyclaceae bacterium]MBX3670149.1 hypothetical protein [Rhodocyclaceae bacterium]
MALSPFVSYTPGAAHKPQRAAVHTLFALLALAVSGSAAAQCNTRMVELQFVKDGLQRASIEGDLTTAQDYSDRVRRLLKQLSIAAERCNCAPASEKFDDAARIARDAAEQENRRELRSAIAQCRQTFDEAFERLRACRDAAEN